jgi:hypothetical protein
MPQPLARPPCSVGACLRCRCQDPSARWSVALTAHLAGELTGHAPSGTCENDWSRARRSSSKASRPPRAAALGPCLRAAVEAANRATADDEPATPRGNMEQARADAIAREVAAAAR